MCCPVGLIASAFHNVGKHRLSQLNHSLILWHPE